MPTYKQDRDQIYPNGDILIFVKTDTKLEYSETRIF